MNRPLPAVLFAMSFVAATTPATAADFSETSDLKTRVDKLTGEMAKLSKGKLKKFYAVKYSDSSVTGARHQCYLALVDQVNLRKDNKQRLKDLKRTTRDLTKLRAEYGKLVGLSGDQVAACEDRRTEECEKLLQLPDDHKTRYFRSEIDIVAGELRSIAEAIDAHEKMAGRALDQCRSMLNSLG